ncbi:MAG: hypothetical protein PHN90_00290 [Methanothrix sp.]|jgi:hypothetical protein|nr:hypothetical protein [Methanothrix sp.]NLX39282.1 hypothetical protein [Methanothrix sp.]
MPRRESPDHPSSARQSGKRDEDQEVDEDGDIGYKDDKGEAENFEAEEYDFLTFIKAAGFEEDELLAVITELEAYRSIPGTTLNRYVHRVENSVETDCRAAFLKGVIVGTAISQHLVVDRGDAERRIEAEVRRRVSEILSELERV